MNTRSPFRLLAILYLGVAPIGEVCDQAVIRKDVPTERDWQLAFAVPYQDLRLRPVPPETSRTTPDWLHFNRSRWSPDSLTVFNDEIGQTTSLSWPRVDRIEMRRGNANIGKGVALGAMGGAYIGMAIGGIIAATSDDPYAGWAIPYMAILGIPIGAVTGGVVAGLTPNWVIVYCGGRGP